MGPPARRRCNHEPASGGEDRRDPGARRSRAGGPRRALPDGGRSEAEPPERSAEPTRDGGATMKRLFLTAIVLGAAATARAQTAQCVVTEIVASNDKKGVDARLERFKGKLTRPPFSAWD